MKRLTILAMTLGTVAVAAPRIQVHGHRGARRRLFDSNGFRRFNSDGGNLPHYYYGLGRRQDAHG